MYNFATTCNNNSRTNVSLQLRSSFLIGFSVLVVTSAASDWPDKLWGGFTRLWRQLVTWQVSLANELWVNYGRRLMVIVFSTVASLRQIRQVNLCFVTHVAWQFVINRRLVASPDFVIIKIPCCKSYIISPMVTSRATLATVSRSPGRTKYLCKDAVFGRSNASEE